MNALSSSILWWTIGIACLIAAMALTFFSRKVRSADEAQHEALSKELDQLENELRRITRWMC